MLKYCYTTFYKHTMNDNDKSRNAKSTIMIGF